MHIRSHLITISQLRMGEYPAWFSSKCYAPKINRENGNTTLIQLKTEKVTAGRLAESIVRWLTQRNYSI